MDKATPESCGDTGRGEQGALGTWRCLHHWPTQPLLFPASWGWFCLVSRVLSKLMSALLRFLEQHHFIISLQKAMGSLGGQRVTPAECSSADTVTLVLSLSLCSPSAQEVSQRGVLPLPLLTLQSAASCYERDPHSPGDDADVPGSFTRPVINSPSLCRNSFHTADSTRQLHSWADL